MQSQTQKSRSLSDWLSENGKVTSSVAYPIVCQLIEQVKVLHQSSQVHREIVAENVSIDQELKIFVSAPRESLVDCGATGESNCQIPEFKSLPELMLPCQSEQAIAVIRKAGLDVTPYRVDFYQLGVLMVKMLTGGNVNNYLMSPKVSAGIRKEWRALIDIALGFDSNNRAETIDELKTALGKIGPNEVTALFRPTPAGGIKSDTKPSAKREDQNEWKPDEVGSGTGRLPFDKLGEYLVARKIGQGGMGDVYLGHDVRLDRPVALKVLPREFAASDEFVTRFVNEARAAAKLVHPNIVPIYYTGEDDGNHFFAMQFVDGRSLAEIIREDGALDSDLALEVIEQIAGGLAEAHSHGLVHRDIKPANILIDNKTGTAKLTDFGLVKSLDSIIRSTATGVIMGTVDYISPEQGRGNSVDGRADLYSLGATLYHLVTGRLPFHAENPTAMIFQHVYEQPTAPSAVAEDVSPAIETIINRLMQKLPASRYQTADALIKDIQAIRSGADPTNYRPEVPGVAASQFDVEGMMNWEAELSQINNTNISKIKQGIGTQALGLFNEHAPEALKNLQNTYFQIKGGLAVYSTRRNELAELVEDSRSAEKELERELQGLEVLGDETKRLIEKANDGNRVELQLQFDANQSAIEVLKQSLTEQKAQTLAARKRLDDVDSTLEDLRSRQEMLTARLDAVDVQAKSELKTSRASTESRGNGLGILAVVAALLAVGVFAVWFQLNKDTNISTNSRAPSTESNEQSSDIGSTTDSLAKSEAVKLFDTVGSDEPGMTVWPDDGIVNYNPIVNLKLDSSGSGWSRDGNDIILENPTPAKRLAIPVFAVDYDLDFEYISEGGGMRLALPIGSEGRAILEVGYNEGNGIRMLGVQGERSGADRFRAENPDFALRSGEVQEVWVWVHEKKNEMYSVTVKINKVEALVRERKSANFVNEDNIQNHAKGPVILVSGIGENQVTFEKLGVRIRNQETTMIRKLTPPPRFDGLVENQGLMFDGERGRVTNVRNFEYDGSHPLTVEAWVIPEDKSFSHISTMCHRGHVGMISLRINHEKQWEFGVYNHKTGKQVRIHSDIPVKWGERTHLAGIYTVGQIELFVNGVSAGKSEYFEAPRPSGGFMRLGSDMYGGGENHFFKGVIDEFRTSRTARYSTNFIPDKNLKSDDDTMFVYDLNEGTGSYVVDRSGNGIHAIIKSGKWTGDNVVYPQ